MTESTITPNEIAGRIEALRDEISALREAVHGAGPGPVDAPEIHDFLKTLDRTFTLHADNLSVYLNQLRA
jgi:hypothetical protein